MGRVAMATVAAAIASSFTDWAFMGVLWHEKYLAFPEIWRRKRGDSGENKAVLWACLLNVLPSVVIVAFCARLKLHGLSDFKLALGLWLAAPVPLLIGNALFIKIHPKVTIAHCLGWLAKFAVAACAAVIIL
jgi:hypothetical protein